MIFIVILSLICIFLQDSYFCAKSNSKMKKLFHDFEMIELKNKELELAKALQANWLANNIPHNNSDDNFIDNDDNIIIDERLNDLDQNSSELIEVIKGTYVVAPPLKELKYNFSKKSIKHIDINGQEKQPILVNEKIFKNKLNNGFFVEAGAWDGESFSNTLFFELKKNWTGLLVEPNPDAFEMLIRKYRKTWLFGKCLSTKITPEIVDFDASGLLGGIIFKGRKPGSDPDAGLNIPGLIIHGGEPRDRYKRRTIKLQCFPLYSVLKALGNPTVHYLSLDVEGSEFQILKTIPFHEVDIKVIDLEVKNVGKIFPGTFDDISTYLNANGYDLHFKISDLDAIFVKRGFLDELNEL